MLERKAQHKVKKRTLRPVATLVLAVACALAPASVSARQGGSTQYVYDDNGRLQAVILPSGEAAVYEYDAAGNIAAIRRLTADTLSILTFSPREGIAGDLVSFVGTGFGSGVTGVSFNGAAAQVVSASPTRVVAAVPAAATTGLVTITTARGSVTTSRPFTVRGVRVIPATARLLFGEGIQFTAVVAASINDQTVTWSVNGVPGGNAMVGTISPSGFYTAPGLDAPLLVVRATSAADPSLYGEAQVTVRDPASLEQLFAPGVSVQYGLTASTVVTAVQPVSVRHGGDSGINAALSQGVSVQRGLTSGTKATAVAPVSVWYGSQTGFDSAQSPNVAVTTGPAIVSVAPASVARNTTVTLTITGANLNGATGLKFFDAGGTVDTNLTVTNLAAGADGTTLTATLAVAGGAASGRHVVVVTAASGTSPYVSIGPNVITVAP